MVISAGLVMAASFGLAEAGVSSAAVPAVQHVLPGSKWTLEDNNGGGCEVDTFQASGTFTSDLFGDSGTWIGGGATIKVKWTAGQDTGFVFKGTFTRTPVKEYTGTLNGPPGPGTGQLVKGVVSFNGHSC
jgi:hypothetical protein